MNKLLTGLVFVFVIAQSAVLLAEEASKPPQRADFLQILDKNVDGKVSKDEFFAGMEKKFQSMDVDKSDVISVQELKVYGEKDEQERQKLLQAAKGDTSEKLHSEEAFIKLFVERGENEFEALDKNNDQNLTASELSAGKNTDIQNAIPKMAAGKSLSKQEFIALFTESGKRNFIRLDKDYNGQLSKNEMSFSKSKPKAEVAQSLPKVNAEKTPSSREQHKQVFIKSFFVGIDANNDNQISDTEKKRAFTKLFNRLDNNHDQFITPDEIIAGRQAQTANTP